MMLLQIFGAILPRANMFYKENTDECFDMDIDVLEEYATCVNTEEKLHAQMSAFKEEMSLAKRSRDTHRYEQVRMQADILAKTIQHVQKTKERWELDVMDAFERSRPRCSSGNDGAAAAQPKEEV